MQQTLSKLRERRAKGENGFTLIELLVVVVILGVLIAIAVPLYLNYRRGANDSAAQSDLRNAISTLEQCNAANSGYPATAFTGGSATAATSPAAGTCTGQTINLSNGTTLSYKLPASPIVAGTGYIIVDTNASGSGKIYCYNSTLGGAVKAVTAADLAAASC